MSYSAVVIPVDVDEPIKRVTISTKDSSGLADLQALVGGDIEAVPVLGNDKITTYIHDEGKFVFVDDDGQPIVNSRATTFMGPGLFAGDYIAGPLVITGFDAYTGDNKDAPADIEQRIADAKRELPEPVVDDKVNDRIEDQRTINYEYEVSKTVDGDTTTRKLAVLHCTFRKAGVSYFSGNSYPTGYIAGLSNETDEVTEGSPFRSRSFTIGQKNTLVMSHGATRYSKKVMNDFAEKALASLTRLYGESDYRVTRHFKIDETGGAL